jgi:hypothetical protein
MSVKNFRFVSPGVFVDEIDNSQIPASPAGIGPVIIGRAEKGPGLRPITVNSFEEFVNVFGAPGAGAGGSDVWRTGASTTAPTYGAYAAQAYLRNSSPLSYVRLLGAEGPGTLSGEGEAGWDAGTSGKAWGLVVFEVLPWTAASASYASGSNGTGSVEGALAAVFYTTNASTTLQLSGNILAATGSHATEGTTATGSSVIVKDTGVPYEFKMLINSYDGSGTTLTSSFNFNQGDSKYIRKVFNTNPQKTNSTISNTTANYWLGESFDRHMKANIPSGRSTWAAVVELTNTTNGDADGHRDPLQSARSPIVIGCDTANRGTAANAFNVELMPSLFTIHALEEPGSWTNKNLKVSVQDIKISTNESNAFGSFALIVRKLDDSDNVVKIVEQFTNCNLNPDSLDYVARKVGDRRRVWVADERRYRVEGNYNNRSDFIRVQVASDVENYAVDAAVVPFGFKGITKYADESTLTTNESAGNWVSASSTIGTTGRYSASTDTNGPQGNQNSNTSVFSVSGSALTASVLYPAPELRVSASAGNLPSATDSYFGLQTTRTSGSSTFDSSTIDLLLARGGMVTEMFNGASSGIRDVSMFFTLDDVTGSGDFAYWVSGSHAAGTSLTNQSGAISGVLGKGFDRFTVPLYGGFDGLDITEMDPFNSRLLNGISSITEQNSYQFNSIKRAIDSTADPEVVEMNLASIPGLTHEGLTGHLINVCEDRADALAVIDLKGGFQPREDSTEIQRNNTASTLTTIINNLRDRALNSSYGCAFYPWVRARDTIGGNFVWLPPSIAALGTFSSSQRRTQVWFAPAGFNRGGLTEGAAGIPVVDVSHQLRRVDRDDLYAASINPIAKFPAEGIVIFGQKTLQVTPSALDRINVRRLMIFIKKRISQIAARLLFSPNVATTWNRFLGAVNPFLGEVKTQFGLSEFRVVLDETTTTPDLVDRNVMYAQIFLKPTRSIEFIAIDFNITRTGASFND